jgi:tetraacyldisaccharide 4'-kinase
LRPLSDFAGLRVHAVAGIGNPDAFFAMLREAGLNVVEHPFADHAEFRREDLDFGDGAPVLMTQKDAVRCRTFADERMWAVHLELMVASQAAEMLLDEIRGIPPGVESQLVK